MMESTIKNLKRPHNFSLTLVNQVLPRDGLENKQLRSLVLSEEGKLYESEKNLLNTLKMLESDITVMTAVQR